MDRNIRKVAVIGTGVLGTQIAVQAAHFGYEVSTYDSDPQSFDRAQHALKSVLKTAGGKGTSIFGKAQWDAAAEKVQRFDSLKKALNNADLVIEAIVEDIALKREVFKEINALAPRDAILATNSSSIPISKIEDATTRPEQCLNMHFYYPLLGTNMVDIMGGSKTTAKTMEAGTQWIRSIGCVPLQVKKEILGFCFNRVWRAVKRETLYMWAEGFVDHRDIDRAWMIFTGMPRGPFGLMDHVGLDVIYDVEMVYYNESKDPTDHPPEALKAMIDRKELGLKTGKGFYSYPDPEYRNPDFLKA